MNHYVSTRPVFDGSWHHVAYVDNAGAVQFYVDGQADTNFSYNASGSLALNVTSLGALVRSTVSGWFNGTLDDVIVWGRELSQAEVQAVMTNSLPVPPPTAPFIISQSGSPVGGAYVGDNLSFFVQASGTTPLAYRWSKDGVPLSVAAHPSATNATLTLTNLQLSDRGSYWVVVSNIAGSVTSSVIPLVVGTYTPVTNGLALAADVDLSGSPNTQPGFQMFTLAANGAAFGNAVTVTLSAIGGTLSERDRTTAPMVVDQPPDLTQARLYNDFVFAASTTDGSGMNVLISHLAPRTPYGVTVWSFDPQSPGSRVSDWTETASGSSVPIVTGYTFDGSVLPAADYDYTFGALLTSSAAGQLQLQGLRHGGTSYGVFLDALQLVANPGILITAAQWTSAGNLQLTVQLRYPGESLSFESSTSLNPPAWQPVAPLTAASHGPVVTAEFTPVPGPRFYRALHPSP